jgi:RNA polymerase sigma factor (sigma-70 family)
MELPSVRRRSSGPKVGNLRHDQTPAVRLTSFENPPDGIMDARMPNDVPEPAPDLEESHFLSAYQKTRKSLIERLGNWEDQKSWDEFYQTYWRLIYSVALKSGLRPDEAMDAVQEVVLALAKQSKKQQYDPKQGSFKVWLMNLTRWRINDQYRRRAKDTHLSHGPDHDKRDTATFDRFADPRTGDLERLWNVEWARNLLDRALARVKTQVSPKQFQIFDAYVVKDWSVGKVMSELGVSLAQVYLAKHRVGKILKHEIAAFEKSPQ